jgi:hypothetical protein
MNEEHVTCVFSLCVKIATKQKAVKFRRWQSRLYLSYPLKQRLIYCNDTSNEASVPISTSQEFVYVLHFTMSRCLGKSLIYDRTRLLFFCC